MAFKDRNFGLCVDQTMLPSNRENLLGDLSIVRFVVADSAKDPVAYNAEFSPKDKSRRIGRFSHKNGCVRKRGTFCECLKGCATLIPTCQRSAVHRSHS